MKQLKTFVESKGFKKVSVSENFESPCVETVYRKGAVGVVVTERDDTTAQVLVLNNGQSRVYHGESKVLANPDIIGPLMDELDQHLNPKMKKLNAN